MSRITQPGATSPLDLFQTNSNPGGTYNYADPNFVTYTGMKFQSSDGRWFAIAQNGAVALVAGHLNTGPADTANHNGLVTVSFTAYSANGNQPAQVTVTMGGTGVLPNEYQGGYAVVATGTGIGQTLKIASHPGQTATTGNVVITLEDSPAVALDATSTINLLRNPYGSMNGGTASTGVVNNATNGIVVCSATASARGQIVGATLYAIPASTSTFPSYGLIQVSGPIGLINDAATTKGLDLMPSSNTAGAVMTYVASTSSRVGTSMQTGTSTDACMCVLELA